MATNQKNQNEYDFIGLPIEYLITEPLLAVTKAQNAMAKEQLNLVLEMCFTHNDGTYEPKVINMTLTRAVIDTESGTPQIDQIVTQFSLPVISIFPINTLGLDTINIAFEIDVLNQYSVTQSFDSEVDSANISNQKNKLDFGENHHVDIWGRVAPKSSSLSNNDSSSDKDARSSDFGYAVDVVATPLPLTKGMLSIIDLYTSAIEPIEMPTEKND